jgi:hypothetical protein
MALALNRGKVGTSSTAAEPAPPAPWAQPWKSGHAAPGGPHRATWPALVQGARHC